MSDLTTRRRFLENSSLIALASTCGTAFAQSAPRSSFGAESNAEEVTAGLDLSEMTAIVTGCNSGIGYETMRVLALRGAHVIGTARSVEKGREAADSVTGRVTPVVLELTDFDSVVACAEEIQAMDMPIDMLILNAGVLLRELQQVRGFELQFVVNHLGHFILGNRLMDRVIDAPEGRVVVVGSTSHRRIPDGGIQFGNLAGEGWADQAYGQYFADCNPAGQSEYQVDEAMAARLWEVSEELTRDYLL